MAWNQWSTIRGKLRTFLNDASGNKWSDVELMDYSNWALEDLVRFRARRRRVDYLATELEVDIPADFYKPLVVEFPDGEFVEEIKLEPGVFFQCHPVPQPSPGAGPDRQAVGPVPPVPVHVR